MRLTDEQLVRNLTRAAFEYAYELPMDMSDELNMPPKLVEAERAILDRLAQRRNGDL